jgi:2-polyprenyl-3-methyl-5-hydroxy-6-metoxy-1,4-benzoquinol methylase
MSNSSVALIASPEQTVKKTLQHAESFYRRHSRDKAVSLTYGYFTHHPVAPLNRKRLKMLLGVLENRSRELKRPLLVLDLACGGGLITCAIAAMGHRTLGLDLSHDEIRMARLFAQEETLNGMFEQTDLLADLAWEKKVEETLGGKPDVVILAYALHHMPPDRIDAFAHRLGQWLDSGAILLINEENPASPLFRLKHEVRTLIQKDTEVEWHRTFGGWRQLLEPSGFRLANRPMGADIVPALGAVAPGLCWSLVFTAVRG